MYFITDTKISLQDLLGFCLDGTYRGAYLQVRKRGKYMTLYRHKSYASQDGSFQIKAPALRPIGVSAAPTGLRAIRTKQGIILPTRILCANEISTLRKLELNSSFDVSKVDVVLDTKNRQRLPRPQTFSEI